MLADLDEATLKRLLDGAELPRLTHRTLFEPGALTSHLTRVRQQGYAIDDEERGIGIRCLAAPIRDAKGNVAAGVSVAGAIFHMTDETIAEYRELVLRAAAAISERLGHDPARDAGPRRDDPADDAGTDAAASEDSEAREATPAD